MHFNAFLLANAFFSPFDARHVRTLRNNFQIYGTIFGPINFHCKRSTHNWEKTRPFCIRNTVARLTDGVKMVVVLWIKAAILICALFHVSMARFEIPAKRITVIKWKFCVSVKELCKLRMRSKQEKNEQNSTRCTIVSTTTKKWIDMASENMCARCTHENRIIVEIICRSGENCTTLRAVFFRVSNGKKVAWWGVGSGTAARYDHCAYKFYLC